MFGIDDAIVGSVAGGLTSGLLNYMGTQDTNQANLDQALANNSWSASQYATRYQTQVKDLQAAGLNPMLAYSQSPGQAPTAQQIQFQNPLASATQAFNETARTGSQVSQTPSQVKQQLASAISAESQAKLNAKQESLVEANTANAKAQLENIPEEGKRLRAMTWLLKEQADVAFQDMNNKVAARNVINQTLKKLEAETTLLNFDISAAEELGNIGRESQQLKPIVDAILSIANITHGRSKSTKVIHSYEK